jgi:beta-lactamase regulating signal transducer with metallopeptidase domain
MTAWMGTAVAGAVLNGILEGTLLVTLMWLALRLLPRTAAATRYAVWSLALVFTVLLPLIEMYAPESTDAAPAGITAGSAVAPLVLPPGAWAVWALCAWGAVSLILSVRVIWGVFTLRGLKRRAVAPPPHVRERFEELLKVCPGRRRAEVLVSDEVSAPVAAGLAKPAVLLPRLLASELSDVELEQVMTHELAHIRRGDDWTNLAQKTAEAVLFFHPAVIWIARRLALEREIACDDWVVGRTGAARPYAACLARLAALGVETPQLAPGAVARRPQLSMRVEALLAGRRHRGLRLSKTALGAAAAVLAAASFAAAPLAPVAVAPPQVPDPARPAVRRDVPAIAYAVPKAVPPRPRTHLARRAPIRPEASAEKVAMRAVPLRPELIYYVVCFEDGETSWIRIVWVHTAPAPVLNHT